MPKNAQN
ncbi:hypothetical protein F383_37784 [Gossypium arboreum]|nr:hypothetical protein F383_37784 [Gossypium arboreum]